jgi:atypical dual specificity phosphatase
VGVSVVVNLQEEQQDAFAPYEKIDGYLWLPAPDGRAPSLEQISQGVAFIQAAIRGGRMVFVHCKAGQGRAPLLCACYLIAEGASTMEAIKSVQSARPSTQLTPEQSARLREFAAAITRADLSNTSSTAGTQTPFDKALPPRSAPQNAAPGSASVTDAGSKTPAPVVIPAPARVKR